MPVFNAESFVKEAVDSILAQTYSDFELLLIDDGSTDGTHQILRALSDDRIRVIMNDGNRGVIFALNRGLDMARGEYIARMDADDIAVPHRLAAQVSFLDANPDVEVCGTWFKAIGARDRVRKHPVHHDEIIEDLLHVGCVIGHPTVMFRRAALQGLRYEFGFEHAEDYRLWALLSKRCRFANLPEVLLLYRTHADQVSGSGAATQRLAATRIQAFLAASVIPQLAAADLRIVERAFSGVGKFDEVELCQLRKVLCRLIETNDRDGRYRRWRYNALVARVWFRACLHHAHNGRVGFRMFWTAPVAMLREWPAMMPVIGNALMRRTRKMGLKAILQVRPQPPVAVRLSGDLASQMFQYSSALAFAEEMRSKLGIDTSDFQHYPRQRYRLERYALSGRPIYHPDLAGYEVIHEHDAEAPDRAMAHASGRRIYLMGEWRDPAHFLACRARLLAEFRPVKPLVGERASIIEKLRAKPSVAVLVCPAPFVIGGQLRSGSWPSAADGGFYARGISAILSSEPSLNVVVFAVQPKTFTFPIISGFTHLSVTGVDDQSTDDLLMLSEAKHFVIPASAFGWWAAWLGTSPAKRVIAPLRWRLLFDRTWQGMPSGWEGI